MKGLYRKLAAIYLVSAAMLILIFSVSLYIMGRSENEHYLYQLLENVENNYIRTSEELRETGQADSDMERQIRFILRQATTEYATSIFAVGKTYGEVLGMTQNNQQEIRIRNVDEGAELLDYLAILPKDEAVLLYINGKYQNAVVRELDNIYLTAFSDLDRVTDNVKLTFWTGVSGMAAVSLLTVLLIRHHLRKYLFGHFIKIKEGIYSILRGEKDMYEDDSEIPELKPLVEMIFKLEQEYIEKSRGMDRMEDQLNEARSEAEYDRLTGLYNRTGFERRAEAFLGEENRKGAMVLLDLDNFKRVNDSEGHPAGDEILRKFAGCLSDTFRREDVIGRLGGDEFVVLIRNEVSMKTLEDKFKDLLDKVRRTLAESYEKYQVSASIGAVPVDDRIRDYKKLYQCADTALYISKFMGKDQFYINDMLISCMRRECIMCRADCPRSRIFRTDDMAGGE